jgi:predicted Zn-dependent peptidase
MGNLEGVSLKDAQRVAESRVAGENLTMLVVGDAKTIEPKLKEIGVPIVIVDHQGRTLD